MNSLRTVSSLRDAGCSFLCLAATLLPALLSSCDVYRADVPAADYCYLNPVKNLSAVGRVAIVELDNDSSYPAISTDVTEALFSALQKKQVFGLTAVSQNDPAWRSLQLDLDLGSQIQKNTFGALSTCTFEQLFTARKVLRCDAILIGTITEYRPYPHMVIGLRLKLVDLKDGQLLWALEQIWDSADKTTEYRIKKYFQSQMRSGFAPLREQLVIVSSLKFIKFVAYEVAETLRPGPKTQPFLDLEPLQRLSSGTLD